MADRRRRGAFLPGPGLLQELTGLPLLRIDDAMDADLAFSDAGFGNRRGDDSKEKYRLMPRQRPRQWLGPQLGFFGGEPQSALSRAVSSGLFFFWLVKSGFCRIVPDQLPSDSADRRLLPRRARLERSTTKPLLECSTERHQARGRQNARAYSNVNLVWGFS